MLLKQLQHISQLDQQINDLHLRLTEFYRERARILDDNTAADSAPVTPNRTDAPTCPIDSRVLYDQLKTAWEVVDIKLPTYNFLKLRLSQALETLYTLQETEPKLNGHLHVVAVPPHKSLSRLLEGPLALPHHYIIDDEIDLDGLNPSSRWNFVIVSDASLNEPVRSLDDGLGRDEFRIGEFDCRALGLREVVAADIQGLDIIAENKWTLLLKDAPSPDAIPCVMKQDDKLIFDIDDASYLLGDNFMQPAIATS